MRLSIPFVFLLASEPAFAVCTVPAGVPLVSDMNTWGTLPTEPHFYDAAGDLNNGLPPYSPFRGLAPCWSSRTE